MPQDLELSVVERGGESLFCYEAPGGQVMLFRALLPLYEMNWATICVFRDGQKIGESMGREMGTHAAISRFTADDLPWIFNKEVSNEGETWVKRLKACDLQPGDSLKLSCPMMKETASFAGILKNMANWMGLEPALSNAPASVPIPLP